MSETDGSPYRPIHIDGEAMAKYIQFGNGEPIPCTDIHIEWEHEPKSDPLQLPLLNKFEGSLTAPISSWGMSRIMRAIGEEATADRIDFEAHRDLAELNVMLDGFYGDQRDIQVKPPVGEQNSA